MSTKALAMLMTGLIITVSCKEIPPAPPVKLIPYRTYIAIEHPFYGDCKGNIIRYKVYENCIQYTVDSLCKSRAIGRDISVPDIELWVPIENNACPHELLVFRIID
jgi:hypothetical protein